jgi:hypothetical protein
MINNFCKESLNGGVTSNHWDLKNKDKPYEKVIKGTTINQKIVHTIDDTNQTIDLMEDRNGGVI